MLVSVHKFRRIGTANLLASFIHTFVNVSRITTYFLFDEQNDDERVSLFASHFISCTKKTHCIALLEKCLFIFHVIKTSGYWKKKCVLKLVTIAAAQRECTYINSWIMGNGMKICKSEFYFFTGIFHFISFNECIWKIEENHSEEVTPKMFVIFFYFVCVHSRIYIAWKTLKFIWLFCLFCTL